MTKETAEEELEEEPISLFSPDEETMRKIRKKETAEERLRKKARTNMACPKCSCADYKYRSYVGLNIIFECEACHYYFEDDEPHFLYYDVDEALESVKEEERGKRMSREVLFFVLIFFVVLVLTFLFGLFLGYLIGFYIGWDQGVLAAYEELGVTGVGDYLAEYYSREALL